MKKKLLSIITISTLVSLICAGCNSANATQISETTEEKVETTSDALTDASETEIEDFNEYIGTNWTLEQIDTLTDLVTGIQNTEFAVGKGSRYTIHQAVEILDDDIVSSVLFKTGQIDVATPGEYDMEYIVFFYKDELTDWMDENYIDTDEYSGLNENTYKLAVTVPAIVTVTEGELTEEDLANVLTGIENRYVLQDSENIDYGYDVAYNDNVIKSIVITDTEVNTSKPDTYYVDYTVTVDKNALDEANESDEEIELNATLRDENANTESDEIKTEESDESDDAESDDLEDVIIEKEVTVVTPEEADKLIEQGESVWTDDNELYGEPTDAETSAKTDTTDTEVASNDTASTESSESSGNTSSSNNSSNSGSSSGSSGSSSGSSNSGNSDSNSSSSSGNTQTHTHSYTGTVTKSATCGSSGTMTYTCSCGASYTESIPATGNHSWVENTTTRDITQSIDIQICNVCGEDVSGNEAAHTKEHALAGEGGGCHTGCKEVVVGTETVGTGTYYCSVCGATK